MHALTALQAYKEGEFVRRHVCPRASDVLQRHSVTVFVERMQRISAIRETLCRLKLAMETCAKADFFQLRKMFWPREYLWEEPLLFSMADFMVVLRHPALPLTSAGHQDGAGERERAPAGRQGGLVGRAVDAAQERDGPDDAAH